MRNKTIQEGKEYLRENFDKGVSCPCCGQFVKLYKRKLTSSMAYGLILMSKTNGWVHLENYFKGLNIPSSIRGDMSKLVYWQLLQKQIGKREDGSNRTGMYKITDKGKMFVNGQIEVNSHVLLFNNKLQGFSNELINIKKSLGNKFNYNELMNL
jgi:hypothetical protein